MNKVFNVNIGGLIFSVDDLAFDKLNSYITSIKSHFSKTDGKEEIIADIEARIAEMLREKLHSGKEVITMEDVDSIIQNMGRPEDFGDGESAETAGSQEKTQSNEYYNPYRSGGYGHKRLFRDPDNKIIGGVCSGIAHYFGIEDPIWIRLAFVAVFFTFGTGFLLYIILMLIIPKAKTVTDKLEMRGEDVTINNIKKNFTEDIDDLKKNFQKFNNPDTRQKVRNGMERFFDFLGEVFLFLGKLIVRILAWIFAVIGIFILIALAMAFFGYGDWGYGHFGMPWAWGSRPGILSLVFLIVLIPVFGLVFRSIRYLFHIKAKMRGVTIALVIIWVAAFMFLGFSGMHYARNFRSGADTEKDFPLKNIHANTLKLNENKRTGVHSRVYFNFTPFSVNTNAADFMSDVDLDIKKSPDSLYHLTEECSARGATAAEAEDNANNIQYNYTEADSSLTLDRYSSPSKKFAWHSNISLTLLVPEGKSVYLPREMKHFIYDVDNTTDMLDQYMVGHTWKMTHEGLTCKDCSEADLKHTTDRDDSDNKTSKRIERRLNHSHSYWW